MPCLLVRDSFASLALAARPSFPQPPYCTQPLLPQVGWLVTAANLGDSRAIIDTGVESHHLTGAPRAACSFE